MADRDLDLPEGVPDEVAQRAGSEPRKPRTDPTLGIDVPNPDPGTCQPE